METTVINRRIGKTLATCRKLKRAQELASGYPYYAMGFAGLRRELTDILEELYAIKRGGSTKHDSWLVNDYRQVIDRARDLGKRLKGIRAGHVIES